MCRKCQKKKECPCDKKKECPKKHDSCCEEEEPKCKDSDIQIQISAVVNYDVQTKKFVVDKCCSQFRDCATLKFESVTPVLGYTGSTGPAFPNGPTGPTGALTGEYSVLMKFCHIEHCPVILATPYSTIACEYTVSISDVTYDKKECSGTFRVNICNVFNDEPMTGFGIILI